MTTYALIFDTSTGAILGPHIYGDSNVTLPSNEVACTQAQATGNVSLWQVELSTSPYTLVQSLAGAQAAQIAALTKSYVASLAAPISFTTASGATDTYATDERSLAALRDYAAAFKSGVPKGFVWRSASNVDQPFTYADLEGLLSAIAARRYALFRTLQSLKAKVRAAKKPSAVSSVVWPE